jgi:dihydrofolate synthase/folylpolyglutamate synthase
VLGSTTLPASVRQVAEELGADVYALGEAFQREGDGEDWSFWGQTPGYLGSDPKAYFGAGGRIMLTDLPDPGLPLDNAASALQALALAGVSLEAAVCRQALATVRLPGRMQWLGPWCLDVGHNPHAAAYVAQRLAARPCAGRTVALIGMLADKDADGVIAALAPAVEAWVPVSLEGERARSADDLADRLAHQGALVWSRGDSPAEAADWLLAHLAPEDRVLVCGSFFTVAAVLAWHQAGTPSAVTTAEHAMRSEEAR